MRVLLALLILSVATAARSNAQEPKILEGHESGVYSVAYSPCGKMLATGGADKTVKFWPLVDAPLPEEERQRRQQLIEDLDDPRFEVRQDAYSQLSGLGHDIE